MNERIQGAQALVVDIMSGVVTQKTHSMLFDEDVVLFSVRLVEKESREWLLRELANSSYPMWGRIEVVRNMRDAADDGLAVLRQQVPDLELF